MRSKFMLPFLLILVWIAGAACDHNIPGPADKELAGEASIPSGTIKIYSGVLHKIDPKIYGHFIEEVGDQIHDGIWIYDEHLKKHPTLDEPMLSLVRRDVFDAISEMAQGKGTWKTVLRWPGGNFTESYFWKRGIGPRDKRPLNKNEFWAESSISQGKFYNFSKHTLLSIIPGHYGVVGPDHNNQFGTDEFLTLCEKLDVEPYINVNYGSGTPEDAADWVEYCNGSIETPWGRKRAENGHPQPYNVKYWGIGNEVWGKWTIGYEESAQAYAQRYNQYAKLMKMRDPTIKLVASGIDKIDSSLLVSEGTETWNVTLLPLIKDNVDYLSIHRYIGFASQFSFFRGPQDKSAETEDEYYSVLSSPRMYQEMIDRCHADMDASLGQDTPVRLLIDEWNLWFTASQLIKANHPLTDGLWAAGVLHVLQKNAPVSPINNFSMLINTFGLIRTDDEGIVKTPSYYAMYLFSRYAQTNYLKTETDSDTFTNQSYRNVPAHEGTPYLDSSATISEDGKRLVVTVINKHLTMPMRSEFMFFGFEDRAYQITKIIQMTHAGNPMKAYNTPENRENVTPHTVPTGLFRDNVFTVPAHSLTFFIFDIQQEPYGA